jgi:hypothetical protein
MEHRGRLAGAAGGEAVSVVPSINLRGNEAAILGIGAVWQGRGAARFGERRVIVQRFEDVCLPEGQQDLGVVLGICHNQVLDLHNDDLLSERGHTRD